ncbi:sigma 54-interacting transcriptional regulator [Pontiella sulfatireligans]|uniref:Nitrogen fixation protein VnfA n=1 Tax=Pontiella sulfatireligans TaxID=2750658 RepID=A0A6C2UQ54_9BACT|nr:sigma 54-interacting transcriptional regulator [Pontiella sulfatireligans]VGO22420.1 Nitrogen fixation protein VnfA [Pontiella sulfatireligans]
MPNCKFDDPKVCDARHIKELETLAQIARTLASKSQQEEILHEVIDLLEQSRSVQRGTIMLLTADGRELRVEAVKDQKVQQDTGAAYRRGEGITGKVLESGEARIVPLVAEEPRFKGRLHSRSDEPLSFICVPISVDNNSVGTLSVDCKAKGMPALEELLRFLSIVAAMIANDVSARRLSRMERQALESENLRLRTEVMEKFRPENMIGNSHLMDEVYTRIHQVAPTDTTVLIRGESGTGKELVAAAIHYNSSRAKKPFVKVNCAALNENLLESELFGHEKGAFTGALQARIGRVQEAEGGTLFLDEIGDFSPTIQVKLLRVLQERTYERVGSNEQRRANIRIIAATNADLEKAIIDGQFRQDLYYRINVFPLHLPPLRARRDDVLQLANHFMKKYSAKMRVEIRRISTPAINMLMAYHWPGNVRELENSIEHAVLMGQQDGVIHGHDLPPTLQTPVAIAATGSSKDTLKARVAMLERDLIVDSLKRQKGTVSSAARELGITERMVRYKIKNLGIDYETLFKKRRRKRPAQ